MNHATSRVWNPHEAETPFMHRGRVVRRAVVMGLGRFGGGVGVAAWLAARGVRVVVTDRAAGATLTESVRALDARTAGNPVEYRLGEHRAEDFASCDLLVANPGIPRPWENEWLLAAARSGAMVTTEIALAAGALPSRARTVAVTGTAGKSTTTTMIARGLAAGGVRVVVGGNIGGSLLDELEAITPEAWVVLELSSAMLWWLHEGMGEAVSSGAPGFSPHVAVVTNFFPNHLDWHGSAEHYEASKRSLLSHQRAGDAAVLGKGVAHWATAPGVRRVEARVWERAHAAPGAHNRDNAALALAACAACVGEAESAARAIGAFEGLEHRLSRVGRFRTAGGAVVLAVNDSKCSTPEGVRLALDALGGAQPVRLIAGGADKGVPLDAIAALAPRVERVYAIGATGAALASSITGAALCGTLERAVEQALADARDGDALLLSPGCASWDQFVNFEARGRAFAEALRAHAKAIDAGEGAGAGGGAR